MKKIVSILTVLALVCLCAVPAFAVNTTAAVTVTTDKTTANTGDVITVTASLSANSNLGALTFDLTYDTAAFECVADSSTYVDELFGMEEVNTAMVGAVRYTGIATRAVTDGGTLFTVQLKVLKPGSAIDVEIVTASDGTTLDGEDVLEQVVANSTTSVTIACGHASTTTNTTKEPTCTEAGTTETVCTVCGEVVSTGTIAATGHTAGDWEVKTPATCTEAGEEIQKCTVCGAEVNSREIAALGHDVSEWTVTDEPTCTEAGERSGVCTRCGETVTEPVAALGHDVAEWEVTKEATCTEAGSRTGTCARCGETVTEEIPALGHDFGEWVVVKEATETEEGSRERVCSVCGEKETEVIPVLTTEAEEGTTSTANPEIPQTSGTVVGGITAAAMLAMAAGVAAVTLKKKREG